MDLADALRKMARPRLAELCETTLCTSRSRSQTRHRIRAHARETSMEFEPIEALNDAQTEDLHRFYQSEWWTRGRTLADTRRALENSGVVVGFCAAPSQRLVAFARVLTDYFYKALILDVIVDPAYRGRRLGRALIDRVVSHPRLELVRHFELYCLPELVRFYEKWGFTNDLGALQFMRLTRT